MAIMVQMTVTEKARCSTKVPSFDGSERPVSSMPCLLKEPCSVIRPIFIVRLSNGFPNFKTSVQWNYCYVEEFERYYYISNETTTSALIWEIECIVDVLATFREEILNTWAWIQYSSNENLRDHMLADPRCPMYSAQDVGEVHFNSEVLNPGGCFVMMITSTNPVGYTGFGTAYAFTMGEIRALADKLFTEPDDFGDGIVEAAQAIVDAIRNYIYKPIDSIITCRWLPIDITQISKGTVQLKAGKLETNVTVYEVVSPPVIYEDFEFILYQPGVTAGTPGGVFAHEAEVNGKYTCRVYNNFEPYTEMFGIFPGVGMFQIPLAPFIGIDQENAAPIPSMKVRMDIDCVSGSIKYNIKNTLGATVMRVDGSLGINLPISAGNANIGGMFAGTAATIAGVAATATGGTAVTALGALGAALNTVRDSNLVQVAGRTSGDWTEQPYVGHYTLQMRYRRECEYPSNHMGTIGTPVFKQKRLGDYPGFTSCVGAQVRCWGTQEEIDMIQNFLNVGIGNNYGGFIVE